MTTPTVILLISDPGFKPHAERIIAELEKYEVFTELRIVSAFKTPARLLAVLEEYESDSSSPHVYITVASYSDALSGLADTRVTVPVIACPPVELDNARGEHFPAVEMPTGVAPMLVLGPQNAALAAVKILSLAVPALAKRVERHLQANVYRLVSADVELNRDALQ